MKIKTTSRKVSRIAAADLDEVEDMPEPSFSGPVATQHGYVMAYSMGTWLRLRFIWRGRQFNRGIERPKGWWTAQGIVRPAKEFAAEIAGGSA